MNKLMIYIMLFAVALVSCDPIENRESIGNPITAEQLNVTATPVVVDGKNSNKIVLENHSPVLSLWDYGLGTSNKAYEEVLLVLTGENKITFTGLNPDGSTITKELTVNVETLAFEVPKEWVLLCGDGSKEWEWDDTQEAGDNGPVVWGNGAYNGDSAPAWWKVGLNEINGHAANEGTGAGMTFTTSGAKLIKNKSDGSVENGAFSFDMSKKILNDKGEAWAKGKFYTKDLTVLCGSVGGEKVYEYDILYLDENKLVLCYQVPNEPGTGYYWMFKAK
ncbi:MAG: hypothetical protein LBH90_09560 [Tannerella sp.]|jgi:hypothetical protein|nr:hypothetical protein [Tannerella sp.]